MALSLALITLLGLLAGTIFTRLKLPGFLGMIILGIVIGPHFLNLIDQNLLKISEDLREIALIIILLRAGLGINKTELKKVGVAALKFSCIPALAEGFTITFISIYLLNFSFLEGGMLGFILAAVSPAVVVPFMIFLSENKIGTDKGIPTIILAGSSIDDIFSITLFTTFLGLYTGSKVNIGLKLLNIPASIILGIILGLFTGFLLIFIFKNFKIKDTKKILYIISISVIIKSVGDILAGKIEIATLLSVMTIGFIIFEKLPSLTARLSETLGKIWIFAEILLFTMVGSQVNVEATLKIGLAGIVVIFGGLIGRSIGVYISTLGSNLNMKERFFCMLAYLPKATVQAAIGGIPLSYGVISGDVILAIAVMSILITAPLGSIAMKLSHKHLLNAENR